MPRPPANSNGYDTGDIRRYIAGFPDMCNAESGEHSNYGSGAGSGDTAFGRIGMIGYFQASSTTSMAFTMA